MRTAAEETGYQGWKNYPTWNVALWINNDEGLQETVIEMAAAAASDEYPHAVLADTLKEFFEEIYLEAIESVETGPISDILGWAMGQVDWREIAHAFEEEDEY